MRRISSSSPEKFLPEKFSMLEWFFYDGVEPLRKKEASVESIIYAANICLLVDISLTRLINFGYAANSMIRRPIYL